MIQNNEYRHQESKLTQVRANLSKVFGEMDQAMFNSIVPLLEWRELPGNQYLFHQGESGDSLFVLLSGRLQVVIKRPGAAEETVGEISKGETVGEMALFTGKPRTAGIIAVRDSVLVQISRSAFEEIVSSYPNVVMNITKLIIERLNQRNVGERVPNRVANIAVIPLSPGSDLNGFSSQLAAKMQGHGNTLHLTAGSVNSILQKEGIANSLSNDEAYHQLSAWLDDQEAKHDYFIYQADAEATEWTKRCLRHADEVLLIAHAHDDPALKKIENALLYGPNKITSAGQVLVLLHEDQASETTNTSQWLSERTLRRHHHLVAGAESDMARLGRFLTGNAIGLVLSGGGAKGLAHIGVYRALVEHNIPIDMIGGTSIGSIISGPIAKRWSPEKLHGTAREAFLANPTPISDYNLLPIVSLLKGHRLNKLLKGFLGQSNIEDLHLSYFCISSNLTKTKAVVHRQGSLFQAVRASISLPGVFPPTIIGKDLHIDGGIFNNLPIDVMEEMGVGHIAAVDFDMGGEEGIEINAIPSTWQIIKSKLWGKKRYNIPSLMATLIQSTTLNSDHKTRSIRSHAGLYFNPDLSKFGLIEWKSFDQIVEAGYQEAKAVLEKWEGF